MSHVESPKELKKGKKKSLTINASGCKYDVVKDCASRLGFRLVNDPKKWCLYWIDTGVSLQRILEMDAYQKINHFPGMSEICRKNLLARNLSRIHKLKEFDFFPKSWILPSEWSDFNLNFRKVDKNVFIVKPDQGCQGKGIFLAKSPKQIMQIQKRNGSINSDVVVQKYILKPYLIDDFKFDLRIYVVVTSMEPLRIFVYNEGLARFATEPYCTPKLNNLNTLYMHLTNYAINKTSANFNKTESGSKRALSSVFKLLEEKGVDVKELWSKICDALVKTLLIVQPQITKIMSVCFPKNNKEGQSNNLFGSQCFEILGFDILLDSKLKPWVLEVNHSPSFATDSNLDLKIKSGLIKDTINLVNINSSMKKKFEKEQKIMSRNRLFGTANSEKREEIPIRPFTNNNLDAFSLLKDLHCGILAKKLKSYEDQQMGNFSRIFPPENQERLDSYLNLLLYLNSLPSSDTTETLATKARKEYLLVKKSMEDLKLLKYQEWKKRRMTIPSKIVTPESKSRSFSLDSILQNKIKDVKTPLSMHKCELELNIPNTNYPTAHDDYL